MRRAYEIVVNLTEKCWFWILDLVGERFEDRNYTGHGNFVSRRGWRVGKRTFWYDKDWG